MNEDEFKKFSDEVDDFQLKILRFCRDEKLDPVIAAIGLYVLSLELLEHNEMITEEQVSKIRIIMEEQNTPEKDSFLKNNTGVIH